MTSAITIIAVCVVVCIAYADADCCSLAPKPSSCEKIQDQICESGYYEIGPGVQYCSAEVICGSKGWTRVGIANFGATQDPCPSGLIEHNENGLRACKIESLSTPSSIAIPTGGVRYTQVCGPVRAYAFGSPDAFVPSVTGPKDIEQNYLDGVSITRGPAGDRQHVFSLAGAYREASTQCPCSTGSSESPPAFVGSDFYCESGNPTGGWSAVVYGDDVLFDGQECNANEAPCCTTSTNFPYFYRDIGASTTDDLELRVLVNQNLDTDENILLQSYAIYVK